MTLLKRLWTGDNKDPEVKTSYQYVVDLKQRVEETCELAKNELAKVQTRTVIKNITTERPENEN